MSSPKTIQLFLPTGKPRGLRIAQVTSRIPVALCIPRMELAEAYSRDELARAGVYFLFGDDDDSMTSVYVGESENCMERLKQHNCSKDFWNTAIVVVTKTNELTKCQIRYLEWYCCEEIKRIGRGHLLNQSFSSQPYVSESVHADLMEMQETIALLLATLDYPIFEPISDPSKTDLFHCLGRGAEATGERVVDGFVVLRGSKACLEETPSLQATVRGVRDRLRGAEVLVEQEGNLVFTKDYLFPSPSQAAGVVLGRSANGWSEWKDGQGRTLHEVHRQETGE